MIRRGGRCLVGRPGEGLGGFGKKEIRQIGREVVIGVFACEGSLWIMVVAMVEIGRGRCELETAIQASWDYHRINLRNDDCWVFSNDQHLSSVYMLPGPSGLAQHADPANTTRQNHFQLALIHSIEHTTLFGRALSYTAKVY